MSAFRAIDGYRLWAPTYSDETAISYLENKLAQTLTPPLRGLRLLDAGCGTGRRLHGTDAASAIGLDQSPEMLSAAADLIARARLIQGDVRDMPFEDGSFDVVWCRLFLGHLPDIDQAYAELARVSELGATVIVSDFHPAAYDAGHRRTFRRRDERIELEHHVHRAEAHVAAARNAGLTALGIRSAEIGLDVRCFYEKAGRLEAFAADRGLPVVLALAFRKMG